MRRHGGVTRVSFRAARLPRVEGIVSSDSRNGRHVVWVEDADLFVAALVQADVCFEGLEVVPSSLEDAFVALTRGEP